MKTMNNWKRRMAVVAATWAACVAWPMSAAPAAGAAGAAAGQNAPRETKEMATVEQFLRLTDAELDQLAQVIARIRAMTPEQRAALSREVNAFCCLPAQQRMQLRNGWGRMDPNLQETWREMMQCCSEARRAEIHAKMSTLTGEKKTEYRKQVVEEYLKEKAGKK